MPVFDDRYREEIVLRDGSRVLLRLVRPDDKERLRRGFERLSPESRYRRFLALKGQLSDGELAYLTEVDGQDHLAIGAATDDDEGVGIARFIRDAEHPAVAEVAVAVVDDWQGKGLGTVLLSRLADAARERGVERFAGEVLAENAAMRDVLAAVPGVRIGPGAGAGELRIELDLADLPRQLDVHDGPLRHIWKLIARGLLFARLKARR